MSQQAYRANLSAAVFPLTLAKAGRSVIIPGPDQNFDRRVDPEGAQKDAGIPQAIYMENVLPTSEGYQSVGFVPETTIVPPVGQTVRFIKRLYMKVGSPINSIFPVIYVHYTNDTAEWHLNSGWNTVVVVGAALNAILEDEVSCGIVNDVSYVYFQRSSVLYTFASGTLTDVTASVLPANFLVNQNIKQICGAYNYLVAVDNNRSVYWSSTTTPVDFQASLVSGAGSIGVNNMFTTVDFIVQHPLGFVLYTSQSVIIAEYTGNVRYPWKFTPISSSGNYGGSFVSPPSAPLNSGMHSYVDKEGGIRLLNYKEVSMPLGDISEYIINVRKHDTFDYTNNTFALSPTLNRYCKVNIVADRYLIISCDVSGPSATNVIPIFESAIVYDLKLNRYGKIKISHTHVFPNSLNDSNDTTTFLFINSITGICKLVYKDIYKTIVNSFGAPLAFEEMKGVLVLGRFQYARSRFLCLDELDIESAQDTDAMPSGRNFSVAILSSLDGKNFETAQTPVLKEEDGVLRSYNSHAEGKNLCIVLKGAFDVSSVEMKFHLGGKY